MKQERHEIKSFDFSLTTFEPTGFTGWSYNFPCDTSFVCPLVRCFSQNWLISFQWFLHEVNNNYSVSLQYLKKELSYGVDVLHTDNCECLYNIICDGFDQASKHPGKFAISFWHLKKEVRNEVRDLTALAGSNITLTIYYTFNVLPPLALFIFALFHTKLFFHLINCLCNVSLIVIVSSYGRSM